MPIIVSQQIFCPVQWQERKEKKRRVQWVSTDIAVKQWVDKGMTLTAQVVTNDGTISIPITDMSYSILLLATLTLSVNVTPDFHTWYLQSIFKMLKQTRNIQINTKTCSWSFDTLWKLMYILPVVWCYFDSYKISLDERWKGLWLKKKYSTVIQKFCHNFQVFTLNVLN